LSIARACAVVASSFRNARRFLIGVRNENAWIVAVCVSNPGYRISVAAGVDRGTLEDQRKRGPLLEAGPLQRGAFWCGTGNDNPDVIKF
jgi:hypothetical protein